MRTILLIAILLVSCGTQENSSKQTPQESYMGARVVAGLVDVPTCTAELEGSLVYVKESEGFKYCEAELWVDIDLSGKDGETVRYTKRVACSLTGGTNLPTGITSVELGAWYSDTGEVMSIARVNNGEQFNQMYFGSGETWDGKASVGNWYIRLENKNAEFKYLDDVWNTTCVEIDTTTGEVVP